MAHKSKSNTRLVIETQALPSGVWTREEALELVADFTSLVGVAAHGRRNRHHAPPFEPEIRSAAGFIAQVDLPNILRAIAKNPEATSVELVRDPKARGESVELLSLASLYVDATDHLAERADRLLRVILPKMTNAGPTPGAAIDALVASVNARLELAEVR